jgi:hypothetical protein
MNITFSNPLQAVPSTMQDIPRHRPIPLVAKYSVIEPKGPLRLFDTGAMI